jgi:hypothetical protein
LYGHIRSVPFPLAETNGTVNEGEEGVIPANTYVITGVMSGSTLSYDDVAGFGKLSAKQLNA